MGIGLFAGVWAVVDVVAAAMCEWQLAHLGEWGWVLRSGCRDVAESWGFEDARGNPVAAMKNPRNR